MCKKAQPPFTRECPVCKKILEYTNVKNRNQAEKKKQICMSCRQKEICSRPELRKRRSEFFKNKYIGSGNPFYGKHHSNETKQKISKTKKGCKQSDEFKKKISNVTSGEKNPMYGRSVFSVWVEKYGEEEATKRQLEYIGKLSKRFSGKNNPMYGKPSPHGSGGGWSGWYKEWYFRSLRELSYMINVIEKKGYKWSNGEKISIKYTDYNNKQRTYRPDFLLNDRILIEIKPKELMETLSNKLKKEAAFKYCEENNLEYRMIDVKILDTSKIIELFKNGIIKFTKKYDERIRNEIERRERIDH